MAKRAPGIRIHPRTFRVQAASAAIQQELINLQQKHELTDIEMLQCVAWWQDAVLKYMLRAERHPDDPERKADEV